MTDYQLEYDGCRKAVEDALSACFTQEAPQRELLDAMRYSLLAGGKRIRPILALQFCKAACGDWKPALDYACAVEMLHTYSLIHDDLPCMDDDDLRRGRPTNHKVFGECSAVLAGDALQAAAFERVLTAPDLPADSRAAAAAVLARAAGAAEGICGGQYLDMSGEGHGLSLEDLTVIHTMKTAALLKAACLMGLAAAPGVTPEQRAAAERYAQELGLAFQIRDDMLDVTATTQELGKPAGSDAANDKVTFATLLGLSECQERVARHTARAKAALEGRFADCGFLCWLADLLAGRNA